MPPRAPTPGIDAAPQVASSVARSGTSNLRAPTGSNDVEQIAKLFRSVDANFWHFGGWCWHSGEAMLRRWAATERQMRDAARGADRLHVKALLELLEPVPETFAASKDHRHDDDMQVVDEIRG